MLTTIRGKSQITLPKDIVKKLGLSEGDQLDVIEKDGAIMLMPVVVYPMGYMNDLKSEVNDIKMKIARGEQPEFDNIDALFESLDK